jgi:hypothetical protein
MPNINVEVAVSKGGAEIRVKLFRAGFPARIRAANPGRRY